MSLDLTDVLYTMATFLLAIGVGDDEDLTFEASESGDMIRLRVRNSKGELKLNVVGEDAHELGHQLSLACLKNLSADDLKLLQMEPLKGMMKILRKE